MYIIKYFLFSIYSTSTLNVKLKRTITLYTFIFFYYRGLVHKKNYPKGSNFIGYLKINYLHNLTLAFSYQSNNLLPLKPNLDW